MIRLGVIVGKDCLCIVTIIQYKHIHTSIYMASDQHDPGDSRHPFIFRYKHNQPLLQTQLTEAVLNTSDPLPFHHSDSSNLVLVSKLLEWHNYGQWCHSMRIPLSAKNKLESIDGSIKAPATTDAKFPIWRRCNDMVLLWTLQSVHGTIVGSKLYCKPRLLCGRILRIDSYKAILQGFIRFNKKLANATRDSNQSSPTTPNSKIFGMNCPLTLRLSRVIVEVWSVVGRGGGVPSVVGKENDDGEMRGRRRQLWA